MEFNNKLKPVKSKMEELIEVMDKEYRAGNKLQTKKWREARQKLTEEYRKENPNWDTSKGK